ncbi:MAG: RES family NAD+ phosphorylase [bacterium]
MGAEPLHIGWILKASLGRWNLTGPRRLPRLYTSLQPACAVAEFEKHLARYGAPKQRDLVDIHVAVGPVLNLTDPSVCVRLDVDEDALVGDCQRDLRACRTLARTHVLDGEYRAILAPSAALKGHSNLMIYFDQTDGIQELSNGKVRETISAGDQWPGGS